MSVRGMEEGLVWIIPLTIIPLTSLRPCPSSVGHLHVHFGCGWPRWVIRGKIFAKMGDVADGAEWTPEPDEANRAHTP